MQKSNLEIASDLIDRFRTTEYESISDGILHLGSMIAAALDDKDRQIATIKLPKVKPGDYTPF